MAIYGLKSATKTKLKEIYGNKGGTKTALKEIYGSNAGTKDLIFSASGIDLSTIDAVRFLRTTKTLSVRKVGYSSWIDIAVLSDTRWGWIYDSIFMAPGYISDISYPYLLVYNNSSGELIVDENPSPPKKYIVLHGNTIELKNYNLQTSVINLTTNTTMSNILQSSNSPSSGFSAINATDLYRNICNNICCAYTNQLGNHTIADFFKVTSISGTTISGKYLFPSSFFNLTSDYYIGSKDGYYLVYGKYLIFGVILYEYEDSDEDPNGSLYLFRYDIISDTSSIIVNGYIPDDDGYGMNFEMVINNGYIHISLNTQWSDDTGSGGTIHFYKVPITDTNISLGNYEYYSATNLPTDQGCHIVSSRGEKLNTIKEWLNNSKYNYGYLPSTNYTG